MSVRARPPSGTLAQDEFACRWPRLSHYRELDSRAFFWPIRRRLEVLRQARA
jgi:hypothetical protein